MISKPTYEELEQRVKELEQAEEALRESEDKYRTLTENLPDVITRYDKESRHLFINKTIENYYPIKIEDYIGKSNSELGYPEEICRLWEKSIQTVFKTGEPLETEFDLKAFK